MKNPFSPQSIAAVLCGFMALLFAATPTAAQNTGPQQLLFAGLRASNNPSSQTAQFNAAQSDANGNLYLLLDQKDGVRLLKTDPTATNIDRKSVV